MTLPIDIYGKMKRDCGVNDHKTILYFMFLKKISTNIARKILWIILEILLLNIIILFFFARLLNIFVPDK